MKKKHERVTGQISNKSPTGITVFDEITKGGLPKGSLTLIFGGPGAGKTVFSLETLVRGAQQWDEPGILVSFEENPKTTRRAALEFGWNMPELERRGKLFLFDARMSPETVQTGTFDIQGLLAGVQAKADEMGARRIVFDAIDVLVFLLNDTNRERQEVFRISDWLSQRDMTGIITVRADYEGILSQRYEFMPFLADCVISLQHTVEEQAAIRTLRVIKYRTSAFEGNPLPFVIGPQGIEIASYYWRRTQKVPFTRERISTGIERLDTMLSGGHLRGSSILITGAPGASKSMISGAFAEACCKRGEAVVYVSFNEFPEELTGNLGSVGIKLDSYLKSGLLRVYAERPKSTSVEEHWVRICRLAETGNARHIIVDPITSMLKAGSSSIAIPAAERLVYFAKEKGITFVCVNASYATEADPDLESVPRDFATMVDTWIHLSYKVQGGERNRAITIVKSRSTEHSNQVREVIITKQGITLGDVYTAGGVVLMGTLRREKEMDEQAERDRARAEMEIKLLELKAAEANLQGKLEAAKRELDVKHAEVEALLASQKEQEIRWQARQEEIQILRGSDKKQSEAVKKTRKDSQRYGRKK
jgi:circadian clock protein KaiC